jgi:glucose-1-phosphate adenylyltransferase
LLPQTIASHRVQAHLFDGYWEDIGTVGAFHQANIELTRDEPRFDFASDAGPIFTRARFLPCSRIAGATVRNSLISDGCLIGRGSVIENSVIGVRARIAENVTIRDSYIMGIDFPETQKQLLENQRLNRPPIGIGTNTVIERAIVDKNARIGRNAKIINQVGTDNSEELATSVIRDGVVVIPKDSILVDGSVI